MFPRRPCRLIPVLSFLAPVPRSLALVSRICRLLPRARRLRSTCPFVPTPFVRRRPRLLRPAGGRPVRRRPAAGRDHRQVPGRLRRLRPSLLLWRRRPRLFRVVPLRLPGPVRSPLVLAAASSWRLPGSLTRLCARSSSAGWSSRLPHRSVSGIPGRFRLRLSRARRAIVNVPLAFGKPSRCVVPAGSDQAGPGSSEEVRSGSSGPSAVPADSRARPPPCRVSSGTFFFEARSGRPGRLRSPLPFFGTSR